MKKKMMMFKIAKIIIMKWLLMRILSSSKVCMVRMMLITSTVMIAVVFERAAVAVQKNQIMRKCKKVINEFKFDDD